MVSGSALVEMSDSDAAWRVINNLNEIDVLGNQVRCQIHCKCVNKLTSFVFDGFVYYFNPKIPFCTRTTIFKRFVPQPSCQPCS